MSELTDETSGGEVAIDTERLVWGLNRVAKHFETTTDGDPKVRAETTRVAKENLGRVVAEIEGTPF